MRTAYLVRHASHDRLDRVLCGRMPGVSLSAGGRAEAAALASALAHRLAGRGDGRLLSSPLDRTRETASALAEALGLAVEIEPALAEVDVGAWTGRNFADLHADPDWARWNAERAAVRPPGGESAAEVADRMAALLDRLGCEDGPPAILVSHAEPLRIAALGLLGLGPEAYDRLALAPAAVSEIALWPGGGRLVSWNERIAP